MKKPNPRKTTIELNEEIKDCKAIIRSNQRILEKGDKTRFLMKEYTITYRALVGSLFFMYAFGLAVGLMS